AHLCGWRGPEPLWRLCRSGDGRRYHRRGSGGCSPAASNITTVIARMGWSPRPPDGGWTLRGKVHLPISDAAIQADLDHCTGLPRFARNDMRALRKESAMAKQSGDGLYEVVWPSGQRKAKMRPLAR